MDSSLKPLEETARKLVERGVIQKRRCRPGCTNCDDAQKPMSELRCDVHEDVDPQCWRECGGRGRCARCKRYANLHGDTLRTDAEEAELQATVQWIVSLGREPPWPVAPRNPFAK